MDPKKELLDLLERSYSALSDPAAPNLEQQRSDFAFHMTDWVNELENLYKLYADPSAYSQEDAEKIIMAFLYHAPSHIVAAARLFGSRSDAFD